MIFRKGMSFLTTIAYIKYQTLSFFFGSFFLAKLEENIVIIDLSNTNTTLALRLHQLSILTCYSCFSERHEDSICIRRRSE